jgi:hypothetical protein
MVSVAFKPIMLSVIMLSAVMLSVVAPLFQQITLKKFGQSETGLTHMGHLRFSSPKLNTLDLNYSNLILTCT